MPIFYPNVRLVAPSEWRAALPSFCRKYFGDILGKELFYIVGLLCSVELLRGIIAALNDLVKEGKIVLEIPRQNFSHLLAMFPRIDKDEIREYVSDVVAESKRLKPARSRGAVTVQNVPTDKLLTLSSRVMCSLVDECDDKLPYQNIPVGESWSQLIEMARSVSQGLDLDVDALTVVVDRLIDSGLVVTDVEEVTSQSGNLYCVRTFAPEGEVVSSKIRQQMMVRNTKWP